VRCDVPTVRRVHNTRPGNTAILPDRTGFWPNDDVFLRSSVRRRGIVAAVKALRDLGADPALLHYDLPGEIAW